MSSAAMSLTKDRLEMRRRSMTPPPEMSPLRIVLLGRTGTGKSASGNTILGRDVFIENLTKTCQIQHAEVFGRQITVIDTPGLCNTEKLTNDLRHEIGRCIELSVPGPHVFLLVIRLDVKFTEEETNSLKCIQKIFSERVSQFTMLLFTCGDRLEGSHMEFMEHIPEGFMNTCGGEYHIFNNSERDDQTQVKALLQKIDDMVEKNGGAYYSSETYKEQMIATLEREVAENERKNKENEMKVTELVREIADNERKSTENKKIITELRGETTTTHVGVLSSALAGIAAAIQAVVDTAIATVRRFI